MSKAKTCPTCNLYAICEGCLREYTMQALTADASCLPCRWLSVEEKQRRAELFMDQDEGFKITDTVLLD